MYKRQYHEGEAKGSYAKVGGLDSYVTGTEYGNDSIIVILTDIFGYKFINNLLIADQLAQLAKIQVVVPDLFFGDAVVDFGAMDRNKWFTAHGPHVTTPLVTEFLSKLKAERSPSKLFGVGHCFGAKFAIDELAEGGSFTAVAVAHPSLLTPETIEKVSKPLLIATGENDASFNAELRDATVKILSEKKDLHWQLDIYGGADHGYAVRGDLTNPRIKYAKEKTLLDQAYFFAHL